MYDIALGDGNQQNRGGALLALLGNPRPGRFRDAWVERDAETGDPVIAVYTRNGGGNRECCCEGGGHDDGCLDVVIEQIQAHPPYLRDSDDDFDSTYATFYFRAPNEARDHLLGVAGEPVDTDKRWLDVIEAVRRG